ncbi:uncharacterized protein LOC126820874 isoform X1 [Patella vulgata]|uniref:uncharacterized protein LOC126820874 isoform X1 n=1 Tax=Patella vulgata TaxID=6465 RepID=UPI00217FC2DD|nr:uncharacterized protein LOC126820874 isoform X1 [Patella vulgata]
MLPIGRSLIRIWSLNFNRQFSPLVDCPVKCQRLSTTLALTADQINQYGKRRDKPANENHVQRDVIEHLNELINGRIITVASNEELQSRVTLLQSLGLSINDIVENAFLVKLPECDILKHAQKIRGNNFSKQQFSELFNEGGSSIPVKYKPVCEVLVDELNISNKDVTDLWSKYSFLKKINSQDLRQKIGYLKEKGLTPEDIFKYSSALKFSLDNLQDKIHKIDSFKEAGYIEKDFNFAPWLCQVSRKESIQKKTHWSVLPERADILSEALQVTKKDLQSVTYFNRVSLDLILKKYELLKSYGISGMDVINRPNIMLVSYDKIKEAVEHAAEFGIENQTIAEIYIRCNFKKIPKQSCGARQYAYLADKLGMPCEKLRRSLDSKWMSERLNMKNNVEFLQAQGFSLRDLQAFPIVLGHEHEYLKNFASSLPHRPELHPFEKYAEDKILLLNSLQYYIEQSVGFTGRAIIADSNDAEDATLEDRFDSNIKEYLDDIYEEDDDEDYGNYGHLENSALAF